MVNFTPAPEAPIEPPEQEEAEPHIGRVIALVLATVLAVLGIIVAGYALLSRHYLLLITAIGLFCVPAFLAWVIKSKNQTSSPVQWGIVGVATVLLTVLGVSGSDLSVGDKNKPSAQEEATTTQETSSTESTSVPSSSENKKPTSTSETTSEDPKDKKDNKDSKEPQSQVQRGNNSSNQGISSHNSDGANSAPAPARNGVPSHQGTVKTATNNWDYTRNTPLPTRGTHPNTNSGNTDSNFVFDNPTPTPKPAPELIPDPAPEETPAPEPIDEAVDNTDDSTSEIVS